MKKIIFFVILLSLISCDFKNRKNIAIISDDNKISINNKIIDYSFGNLTNIGNSFFILNNSIYFVNSTKQEHRYLVKKYSINKAKTIGEINFDFQNIYFPQRDKDICDVNYVLYDTLGQGENKIFFQHLKASMGNNFNGGYSNHGLLFFDIGKNKSIDLINLINEEDTIKIPPVKNKIFCLRNVKFSNNGNFFVTVSFNFIKRPKGCSIPSLITVYNDKGYIIKYFIVDNCLNARVSNDGKAVLMTIYDPDNISNKSCQIYLKENDHEMYFVGHGKDAFFIE